MTTTRYIITVNPDCEYWGDCTDAEASKYFSRVTAAAAVAGFVTDGVRNSGTNEEEHRFVFGDAEPESYEVDEVELDWFNDGPWFVGRRQLTRWFRGQVNH